MLEWYPFLPGSRSHVAPRQVRVSSRLLIALGFTARPLEAATSEPILLCFPDHTHLLPVPPLFSLFHSLPRVKHAASRPTRQRLTDTLIHTHALSHHTRTHLEVLSANMGQILSWIRGPRDGPALQDVAVEEQVCENVSVCLCVCAWACAVVLRQATSAEVSTCAVLCWCSLPQSVFKKCAARSGLVGKETVLALLQASTLPLLLAACWNAKLPVSLCEWRAKVCVLEPSDVKQGRDKACLVCCLLTAARGKAHRFLRVIYVALNIVGVCSGPSTTQSIPLTVLQDSTVRSCPHFLLTICRLRIAQSEGRVAGIGFAIFLLFAQLRNACKVGYVQPRCWFI